MSANNSISQLLEQFIELYNNSLNTFEKTNEAITSDKESVIINLSDPTTGALTSVQVPSFGYLKREIERLNKNVETLTAVGDSTSNVKLKDGTFRKVYSSRLNGPASKITGVYTPTNFKTKSNQFFEDFLNPLLHITLNVTGQIAPDTEKAYIERYVFDGTNVATAQAFDTLYKGANTIDYKTFKTELAQGKYQYSLDASTIELPSKKVQYYGTFDVLGIDNVQKTQVVDGVTQTATVRLFTINKLNYTDSSKTLQDTETLKVGDSLVVNSGTLSTRYIITSLNTDTLQAELSLVEGFESISIGANQLKIYKELNADTNIEINVAFDERQVVFVKAIDPISKIEAEEFSPGTAFYSNELQITMEDGSIMTLADYYKSEVADFGQFIKSLKNDFIPPATVGIIPDAPALDANNFKVVQVNTHLTNNDATNKIKKLKADKAASEQNLKKLDDSIAKKKGTVSSKKYTSTVSKDRDTNELNSLISQRAAESEMYSSIVTQIQSIAASNNLTNVAPKFKIRGFWSIPAAKQVSNVVPQEIVQFKIRYRYLSTTGTTSQVEQIPFNDTTNNTQKTAAFSNWVEVAGPIRGRKKDANGKYYWEIQNEEDAQAVNFNSLDIPIQTGEAVEISIKSLSEAGFPSNPVESPWSDIVKIEFPEGQFAGDTIIEAINQNSLEVIKVEIDQNLTSAGVYSHISDSFTANSKYFSHNATTIASGFLTAEQNPVSLFDKLVEMQSQIEALKAQIAGTLGELQVYIEDQSGNQTVISNNTTVKLFAGYYVDEITNQIDRKGAIVTKSFKLKLANSKATDLELIARLVGDRTKQAYASGNSATLGVAPGTTPDSTVAADTYYTTEGKYDLVPVVYQNLDQNTVNLGTYFNTIPFQSGQLRGQFIYSRFRNLANDSDLYSTSAPDLAVVTGVDDYEYGISYDFQSISLNPNTRYRDYHSATFTASNAYTYYNDSSSFIWTGWYNATTPMSTIVELAGATSPVTKTDYDNGIFLHKDHPILQNGIINPLAIQANGLISMSKNAPRRANMSEGDFQNPYKFTTWTNNANVVVNRTLKTTFDANDQYLLGGHSCGAYLYLAPLEKTSLLVDADNKAGVKRIKQGATNSVSIDLIFQYRMTDYYGVADTTSVAGNTANNTGRIGGIVSNTLTNITYSKKIGLDILENGGDKFTFDIEVFAKYKQEGSSATNITNDMITNFNAGGGGGGGHMFVDSNDFSTPGDISSLRYL